MSGRQNFYCTLLPPAPSNHHPHPFLATEPLLAGTVNYFWGIRMVYVVLGLMNLVGLVLLNMSNATSSVAGENKKKQQGNSLAP